MKISWLNRVSILSGEDSCAKACSPLLLRYVPMSNTEPVSTQLTGVAGVHFVASRLSFLAFHAVPTTRNVRGPDLLVSTLDGSAMLSIQVKTTIAAMRTRGRGEQRKPNHYEWDIGWSSARQNNERLFFALVDLRNYENMPDIYVLPSRVIYKYFEGGDPQTWTRARYHPSISDIDVYRNNWQIISIALNGQAKQ